MHEASKNMPSDLIETVKDQLQNSAERQVVPPIFSLGHAATKQEVVIGDVRVIKWQLTGNEERIKNIASWDRFAVDLNSEDGEGTLLIPEATRNAKSVLSGKEAWDGEKATLIGSVAKYINLVSDQFSGYDTNLSWSSVGITPAQEIFVAPPNLIVEMGATQSAGLKSEMVTVLDKLLENDDPNRYLVSKFEVAIKDTEHGK